jgi:DNA-directed RNA polymerase specialized sigma subunit
VEEMITHTKEEQAYCEYIELAYRLGMAYDIRFIEPCTIEDISRKLNISRFKIKQIIQKFIQQYKGVNGYE